MNHQGRARAGDFKSLQPLQRQIGIAPSKDFHFPVERGGDHRQIGLVLQKSEQTEAGFVGNDLEAVSGLRLDGAGKGLGEGGREGGRSLHDEIVATCRADAERPGHEDRDAARCELPCGEMGRVFHAGLPRYGEVTRAGDKAGLPKSANACLSLGGNPRDFTGIAALPFEKSGTAAQTGRPLAGALRQIRPIPRSASSPSHRGLMPDAAITPVSLSWSAFIRPASSSSGIGLPGMSATESARCTCGFSSAALMPA